MGLSPPHVFRNAQILHSAKPNPNHAYCPRLEFKPPSKLCALGDAGWEKHRLSNNKSPNQWTQAKNCTVLYMTTSGGNHVCMYLQL